MYDTDIEYDENCTATQKIVFLKTHKVTIIVAHSINGQLNVFQCASSSLQNIFLRFGEKHNLNFALPIKGGSFTGKLHLVSMFDLESK